MLQILFLIYLALVLIWFIFSMIVFWFCVQHHLFSVTAWVVIILYLLITINIFSITFASLTKYTPLHTLLTF